MANKTQLTIFRQGTKAWNAWREENPAENVDLSMASLSGSSNIVTHRGASCMINRIINSDRGDLGENLNHSGVNLNWANLKQICLSGANLIEANLIGADLRLANLMYADLSGAVLNQANLSGAQLNWANLKGAYLDGANLSGAQLNWANLKGASLQTAHLKSASLNQADLSEAYLYEADLSGAYLCEADLSEANLSRALLIETDLERATLTGCKIYGISAWKLNLDGAKQNDLTITPYDEPIITVDNLEVAQFVYLLLHNEKIRGVIDTIAKKAVLILGRFTPERKAVLDTLRIELRNRGYLPILFDFDKPTTKDFTETIRILVGMSLFVIADISNPKSSPLELQATVPDYMIPFVPIIQEGEEPFAMFNDLQTKYDKWILPTREYDSCDSLIKNLDKAIIEPALLLHNKLIEEKARKPIHLRVKDFK
jgi:uncharacterized protein YjbI with pentapeptide repeats